MSRELRTNTAIIVTVGPFLDATDGVTLKTALTITNERITLTADTDDGNAPTLILDNIAGATSGTANDLNYITGQDNAMMQIELSAANVNRFGRMRLTITDATNHVPVWEDFEVVSANYYDAKYGTTGVGVRADVQGWLGTAPSTPTVAGVPNTNVKTWNDLAAVALPLIPTTAGRTLDVSSTGEAGVDWANVGSPTTTNNLSGTTVSAVSGAVGSVTGNVGGSVASLTTNNDKTGYGLASTGLDSVVMSDIAAVPAIGASIKAAINWLYCLGRNKRTQDATTETVMKDDSATAIGTSTKSDSSGTFTRGKYS